MSKSYNSLRWNFSSPRDWLLTATFLLIATAFCTFLQSSTIDDIPVNLIYVLAVLIISRLTTGYFYGLLASLIGVVCVNYIFTYPYFALNFTISGYPATFLTLLAVSAITSTLTTQIKRQEQLRLEAEKEKMWTNLLRSVSHDIRTPLTSIVGATSAVLDNQNKLTEDQTRRLLTDVREDAQWLIRVVENLLSITRMGSEVTKLVTQEEAAEEILTEAVRKFRKRFPHIPVEVRIPDELLMVPMDAILIEQVLGNLLENAVHHAAGMTKITASIQKTSSMALFSIKDNGCGISEDVLPTLFDGTIRSGNSSKVDGKRNMGIGLTVCNTIIRAHGGTLIAQNNPNGGADFSFTLPLSIPAPHDDIDTDTTAV